MVQDHRKGIDAADDRKCRYVICITIVEKPTENSV